MGHDPFAGHLYAFTNKRRNKIKYLFWEDNGFVLYYKSLSEEKFKWLKRDDKLMTLTGRDSKLIGCFSVWKRRHHLTENRCHRTTEKLITILVEHLRLSHSKRFGPSSEQTPPEQATLSRPETDEPKGRCLPWMLLLNKSTVWTAVYRLH